MNFLQRIFGRTNNAQPSAGENATSAAPQDAPLTATDDAEHSKTDPQEKIETAPASVERPTFNVAAGATRPLPPEPSVMFTGNEHIVFGQATDIGMVRTNNQDAAFSFFSTARTAEDRPDFGLFVVADGMGGHHDGEKASAVTARTLATHVLNQIYLPVLTTGAPPHESPVAELLTEAVLKANREVIAHVPDGGTTVTAVTIIGDLAYIVHVGDSRIYLITHDGSEQITRDHSLVQRLIELDQLTPEEAADHPQKNVLYRALGQNETLEVDTLTRRLPPNSRLLLCSDGLWNQVEEHEIRDIVMKYNVPQEACEKLVALANARGGVDNVTTILLHVPT